MQTPLAQGWSTTIISMIKWTRTSRLSIKISLSCWTEQVDISLYGTYGAYFKHQVPVAARPLVLPLLCITLKPRVE